MTDLDAPPLAGAPTARAVPPSPAARRLAPPRWRDGRLLAGVLLLLVSVVVGARVVAGSDSTSPVVSVARDLPAGHVLVDGDLSTERVRLSGPTSAAYVGGDALPRLSGRVLARPVRQGELLAVGAVADKAATARRVVPVKVREGRHPDLTSGDRVDLYATAALGSAPTAAAPAASGGTGTCTTVLVAPDLEVAADAPTADATADLTLLLRVAPEQAALLVHASQTAALDVVEHLDTAAPGAVGAAGAAGSPAPVAGLGGLTSRACGGGR